MSPNVLLKQIAIALSLSCLLFFGAIRAVLFPAVGIRSWGVDPNPVEAVALLLLIGISALIAAGVLIVSDRVPHGRARAELRVLFLLAAAAAFGPLGLELSRLLTPVSDPFVNYLLPLCILALCLVFSWRAQQRLVAMESAMRSLLLMLTPAAVVLLIQCISVSLAAPPSDNIAPLAGGVETGPAKNNKVVWIIFDELDQAALISRPAHIETPAFDRLMKRAFVAENAIPPAQDTKESIPSLIYGHPIAPSEPGVVERWTGLTGRSGRDYFRTGDPDLIGDLRRLGVKSGVAGWYIPYERLFGDENTFGEWTWERTQICSGLVDCVSRIWDRAAHGLPLGNPFSIPSLLRYIEKGSVEDAAGQHQRNTFIMGQALKLADMNEYGLRLFHFSVPHGPYASIDREKETPDYFDGLEVADKGLGDLLARFEMNGQLDEITLIVSADHWWRRKTPEAFGHLPQTDAIAAGTCQNVPFIVKFPGSEDAVYFSPTFNTVVTRELITSIVMGEMTSVSYTHLTLPTKA
jgi:hypothetical protein